MIQNDTTTIYHVCTQADWQAAIQANEYVHASLAIEGFIHASTIAQVQGVLDRYYKGVDNLVVLHIDTLKLTHTLKYELAPSVNEYFPHIFGSINIDAVIDITDTTKFKI
jgi:uncharacterized protein (DUF952 family)